jgi:hypothetical protein
VRNESSAREKREDVSDPESAGLTEQRNAARRVIARLREALGVRSDREIGPLLGRSESVAGNWGLRGSVPREIIERVAEITERPVSWILYGNAVGEPAPRYQAGAADPRLDAICDWWRDWWMNASEEERTWALVQLRRAIPESAEPIMRRIANARRKASSSS